MSSELITQIKIKTYDFRGQRVILDSDLAEYYGIETRILNQAVKRNSHLFPADFMFQLSDEENSKLKDLLNSKENKGGNRYNPYGFTRAGALTVQYCFNPKSGQLNFSVGNIKINEKILEEYIAKFPDQFLGKNVELTSQQEVLGGLRPDLIFQFENSFEIVEVQLGQLDRYHLYKSLEYRDLYKLKNPGSKITVSIFCNQIEPHYKEILKVHEIDFFEVSPSVVFDKMQAADDLELYYKLKDKIKPSALSFKEVESKLKDLFD
jgi:hypothetical protein